MDMHGRGAAGNHRAIRGAVAGVWTVATILGGIACGDGPMGPEPEPLEADEALERDEAPPRVVPPEEDAFPHHADVTEVTVGWVAVPQGIERAESLVLVAESHVDEPRRVTPRVLVRGLDDRTAELELAPVELGPRDRAEITVRLDALPVQGISHSVTLLASGTYDGGGEAVTVQTEPLAFHFEAGYVAAYVYTLDTMVTELDGGELVDDPRKLQGRVLDGGGWRAVAGDPSSDEIPAGLGSIEYTYEITTPEERAYGAAASLVAPSEPGDPDAAVTTTGGSEPIPDLPPAWCAFLPWDCCTGDNCVDVCVDWTTTYVDASAANAATKEDYAVGSGTQTVDASYAQFDITKLVCGPYFCLPSTVKSDLLLGPDGCALLDLPAGSGYGFKAKTRLQHGAGGNLYPVEHHTANDPTSNVGVVAISQGFTVPVAGSPLPPPMIVLPQHQAANAAAAMSRTLASGAVADQPTGFTILSGLGCGSQPGIPATDACAGSTVKTGPYTNPDSSAGDLRWKFILAHEIGHVMQKKAMGTLWNPYCFTPGGNVTTNCNPPNTADLANAPASCRCDHVSGSNGLHCLQSFEYTPVAQLEGYAQFFSARVWNAADSTCLFRYYKQFRNDNGTISQPPFNTSCSAYVNWRDNHCFDDQGATEYDWMQFLWNLHAVGSYKYSMHEIYEVYRGACSDDDCAGEAPEWPALEASAAAYFGVGSNKHSKLVTAGNAAGVDTTHF
jgi:hypothetical protein